MMIFWVHCYFDFVLCIYVYADLCIVYIDFFVMFSFVRLLFICVFCSYAEFPNDIAFC